MPNAGKLIAAIIFAVGGYLLADMVEAVLPEGTKTGWLVIVMVLIPLVCAWKTLGNRVGEGYRSAISSGFYGVFISLIFVFFAFSAGEMLKRSTKLRYDGVMEALTGIFKIALEYGVVLTSVEILGTLAAIAVIGGLAAEWAFRRWQ